MDLSIATAIGLALVIGSGFPVLIIGSSLAVVFLSPRRGGKH